MLLSAAASNSLFPRVLKAKGATTLAFPFFLHANPTSFYYSGSQPLYIQLCKLHTTSLYVASLCHKPVIIFIQQMNTAADHSLETSVLLGLNTTAGRNYLSTTSLRTYCDQTLSTPRPRKKHTARAQTCKNKCVANAQCWRLSSTTHRFNRWYFLVRHSGCTTELFAFAQI